MAVYTEVSDEELSTFVASYGLGELLSFKGIAEGVENTNYIVHTTRGPFILTLYERRTAREDLPFFLGLMEHLAARGVSCPTPVRDHKGRNLNELAGRPAGPRHVPGRLLGAPADDRTLRGGRAGARRVAHGRRRLSR